MNDLIGNNNEQTEGQVKAKKMMKIIAIILVLLLVICIGLIGLMYYIQSTQLKITVDGKANAKLQNILVFDGDKIYVPIRQFAGYMGYESYSGDYKQYAEDTTKCYVQSANEIASFSLNSDKIYKRLTTGNDYEYFTIDEPVKMMNGVLYTTIQGAEKAFNLSFTYNKQQNKITIFTLPYLVTFYASQHTNSAIAGNDVIFSNQKALLYNMIVVKNADNYYGVSSLDGKEILGTKYASVQFIESTKEFIVTTAEKKVGIMSYDSATKISPEYDQIKQIDKDAGLYLVSKNKKQGVVNNSGNIVIYLDYDQIGIDGSKYTSNNIKNQYLLYDKCIPVKRNNLWGMFDKNGKEILKVEYGDLGCSAGSGNTAEKTTNNILLVPDYEAIVVKKDTLYGLVNSSGKELIAVALKSVYSITSAGEETYYMIYNEQVMNLITYIKTYVIKENNNENTNTINNNTNIIDNNSNNSGQTTTGNTIVNKQANETVQTGANTVQENAVPKNNETDMNTTPKP